MSNQDIKTNEVVNKTFDELLIEFKNFSRDSRDHAGGYRRDLKMNDSSVIDIREAINKRIDLQELQSIDEVKRENEIDLIHAIEDLDSILEFMVLRKQKKSSTKVDRRFKCRVLIVSLAIKRGFNAELSKDSEHVIIDCY
jgi:hypothetical protein